MYTLKKAGKGLIFTLFLFLEKNVEQLMDF